MKRNMKKQPASASDGVSKGMPQGQLDSFPHLNNPRPMGNLKARRNTGEIKGGTQMLRSYESGAKNNHDY